jgi:uncharacterized protein (TIGR02596 family)
MPAPIDHFAMKPARHPSRAAFTLIELIVVVSIVAILITIASPYVAGVLTSTRLRSAADTVYNRLLEAQSLAILFNSDAELRIYEVPDLIDPASRPTLRKLRILTLQPPATLPEEAEGGEFEPVGAITSLEQGVEISSSADYSTIVDLGFTEPASEDETGRYIALRFRSDGSAGLPPAKPWFLTLHEKDAHLRGTRLKNFITLQIDPATGRLRTFQP